MHDARAPAITVVIAARDAAATLERAVDSALACDLVIQCVVVDDASDDATRDLAAQLRARDGRVELVARPRRGGPSAARNDGLARARGVHVCVLDADDELVPGGLEALARALGAHDGAVVALGRFRPVDADGTATDVGRWADEQLVAVVRRHGAVIQSPDGLTAEALVTRLVSPPPGAWLLDARCVRAVGGFDVRARRSEDLELLVRLAAVGRVVEVDSVVLDYHRHVGQRSAATSRRRWGRGEAMWVMLRAAPGRAATAKLARGMAAYHVELWESRRRSASARVMAMGARNLAAAGAVRVMGVTACALPRRAIPPLAGPTPGAVD